MKNVSTVLIFLSLLQTGQNCFLDVDQPLGTPGVRNVAEFVQAPGSHRKGCFVFNELLIWVCSLMIYLFFLI